MKTNYYSIILDWFSNMVDHSFIHSFRDKWMMYSIWNGTLSIRLDLETKEQKELFDLLPSNYKGCAQYGTGKLVNERVLYFKVEDIIPISYPDIIGSKLIHKEKHQSTNHGWIETGCYFYTYDWQVLLSDETSILYHNQLDKMDMIKGDYIYNARIQEREFYKFLEQQL